MLCVFYGSVPLLWGHGWKVHDQIAFNCVQHYNFKILTFSDMVSYCLQDAFFDASFTF